MNLSIKTLGLAAGIIAISSSAFAQKKNETSAAVEYKNKYLPAFAKQDFETAKKALLSAKEFVDLAAAHEDTKDSQKTMWLKGEIYSHFMILGMQAKDPAFIAKGGEDATEQSIAAFKHGYPLGKKMKSDIRQSVDQKRGALSAMAGKLYEAGQFEGAAELYKTQAAYADAVGMLDSLGLSNAAVCYDKAGKHLEAAEKYEILAKAGYKGSTSAVLASSAYRKAGKADKAKAIVDEARKTNPTDRELLLELVNINIDAGDAAGAESALNDAIATDPDNKVLHFTIGTIYNNLGKNEQAEAALNKALELDPNYVDAQYQLGAILVTWAGDISTKAKQLEFGDPNYNKMLSESEAVYKRAAVPLEKYIASFPNDKQVLTILFQIHRNLGDSAKALEYKRKADAIQE